MVSPLSNGYNTGYNNPNIDANAALWAQYTGSIYNASPYQQNAPLVATNYNDKYIAPKKNETAGLLIGLAGTALTLIAAALLKGKINAKNIPLPKEVENSAKTAKSIWSKLKFWGHEKVNAKIKTTVSASGTQVAPETSEKISLARRLGRWFGFRNAKKELSASTLIEQAKLKNATTQTPPVASEKPSLLKRIKVLFTIKTPAEKLETAIKDYKENPCVKTIKAVEKARLKSGIGKIEIDKPKIEQSASDLIAQAKLKNATTQTPPVASEKPSLLKRIKEFFTSNKTPQKAIVTAEDFASYSNHKLKKAFNLKRNEIAEINQILAELNNKLNKTEYNSNEYGKLFKEIDKKMFSKEEKISELQLIGKTISERAEKIAKAKEKAPKVPKTTSTANENSEKTSLARRLGYWFGFGKAKIEQSTSNALAQAKTKIGTEFTKLTTKNEPTGASRTLNAANNHLLGKSTPNETKLNQFKNYIKGLAAKFSPSESNAYFINTNEGLQFSNALKEIDSCLTATNKTEYAEALRKLQNEVLTAKETTGLSEAVIDDYSKIISSIRTRLTNEAI